MGADLQKYPIFLECLCTAKLVREPYARVKALLLRVLADRLENGETVPRVGHHSFFNSEYADDHPGKLQSSP